MYLLCSDKWAWIFPAGFRCLDVDIRTAEATGNFVVTLSQMLASLSSSRFDAVSFTFYPYDPTPDRDSTSPSVSDLEVLRSVWKCMDHALTRPDYTNVSRITIRLGLYSFSRPDFHQDRNDLLPVLLPALSQRAITSQISASTRFLRHEYVLSNLLRWLDMITHAGCTGYTASERVKVWLKWNYD